VRSEVEVDQAYLTGIGQDATHLTYANGFYISNGTDLAPHYLTTGFATDIYTDLGYTTLTGEVREWVVDSNEDGIVDLATETKLIAQGHILLDPNNQIDLRDIQIQLTSGSSYTSEFNTSGHYLAMIHVAPLTPPSDITYLAPLGSGIVNGDFGNKDYNFAPTDFAFAQIEGGLGRPQSFADFTGTKSTPDDQGLRNLKPEPSLSWHISMIIDEAPYNPVMNTVDINDNIDISIFPNPASNTFTLDVDLEEVSKEVKVEIVDIKGQLVARHLFTHVKLDALKINTSALTIGIYMVNVFTDTGVKSKRLLIQR